MNKQLKTRNGQIIGRGIEWTDWTWNPIGGCLHRCRWEMPDGSTAVCYAESTAEGVAQAAYPRGFASHYWRPEKLNEPAQLRTSSRVFVDSMADLFGHWVPQGQIEVVLAAMEAAPQHTFQSLTKNAPRLIPFAERLPRNLWVGVSSPPDQMWGRPLSREQQARMLNRALAILSFLRLEHQITTWMSIEPLSWDITPILGQYPDALRWAVIGAATDGQAVHQPDVGHVRALLNVCDAQRVPVFFKGNLRGNEAAAPWREFFVDYVPSPWNKAQGPVSQQHLF